MNDLIYKDESYHIMGKCFEVHNNLGPGFLEIVYKDALEYEFQKDCIRDKISRMGEKEGGR